MNQTQQDLIKLFSQAEHNYIEGLDFLIDLVNIFRKQKALPIVDLRDLIQFLETDERYRELLISKIESLELEAKEFDQIISDVGIINYSAFFYEVKRRLIAKLIPHQAPPDSLEFILDQIFYARTDGEWISRIPDVQLIELYYLLEGKSIYEETTNQHVKSELLYGLEVLTQRVSGRAMETDVSKMTPEYRNFDNPFIGLLQEMSAIIQYMHNEKHTYLESSDINYKQLTILLSQCEKYIDDAFANSHKLGISMKVNQSLLRLRQQLQRIRRVLPFILLDDQDKKAEQTVSFIKTLILINTNKTNVRRLINESTQSIAYEITQHTAQTGEHYITFTQRVYKYVLVRLWWWMYCCCALYH